MARLPQTLMACAFVSFFVQAMPAFAQRGDSGTRRYIVSRLNLNDFTGTSDSVVADFDTYEEAQRYANLLNEQKNSVVWSYSASERPVEDVGAGPKLPRWIDLVQQAGEWRERAEFLRELKQDPVQALAKKYAPPRPFDDYTKNVADAYNRAKRAKEAMLATTKRVSDKEFRRVNQLVDDYNRELSRSRSSPRPGVLARLPEIKPMTEETVRSAEPWRQAARMEAKMRAARAGVLAMKGQLDKQRDLLIQAKGGLSEKVDSDPQAMEKLRVLVNDYQKGKEIYQKSLDQFEGVNKHLNDHVATMSTMPQRDRAPERPVGADGYDENAKKPVGRTQESGASVKSSLVDMRGLEGTWEIGSVSVDPYSGKRYEYFDSGLFQVFQSDGTCIRRGYNSVRKSWLGPFIMRWERNGDTITITDNNYRFVGTLKGTRLDGVATKPDTPNSKPWETLMRKK